MKDHRCNAGIKNDTTDNRNDNVNEWSNANRNNENWNQDNRQNDNLGFASSDNANQITASREETKPRSCGCGSRSKTDSNIADNNYNKDHNRNNMSSNNYNSDNERLRNIDSDNYSDDDIDGFIIESVTIGTFSNNDFDSNLTDQQQGSEFNDTNSNWEKNRS